jgi:hypothetical protein
VGMVAGSVPWPRGARHCSDTGDAGSAPVTENVGLVPRRILSRRWRPTLLRCAPRPCRPKEPRPGRESRPRRPAGPRCIRCRSRSCGSRPGAVRTAATELPVPWQGNGADGIARACAGGSCAHPAPARRRRRSRGSRANGRKSLPGLAGTFHNSSICTVPWRDAPAEGSTPPCTRVERTSGLGGSPWEPAWPRLPARVRPPPP